MPVAFLACVAQSVDAVDCEGRTPLHWAAATGAQGFAEVLLRAGADANRRDGRGLTPLAHAMQGGHWRVAQILVLWGATMGNDP